MRRECVLVICLFERLRKPSDHPMDVEGHVMTLGEHMYLYARTYWQVIKVDKNHNIVSQILYQKQIAMALKYRPHDAAVENDILLV